MHHEEGGACVVVHPKEIEFESAPKTDDVERASQDLFLKLLKQLANAGRIEEVDRAIESEGERFSSSGVEGSVQDVSDPLNAICGNEEFGSDQNGIEFG